MPKRADAARASLEIGRGSGKVTYSILPMPDSDFTTVWTFLLRRATWVKPVSNILLPTAMTWRKVVLQHGSRSPLDTSVWGRESDRKGVPGSRNSLQGNSLPGEERLMQ